MAMQFEDKHLTVRWDDNGLLIVRKNNDAKEYAYIQLDGDEAIAFSEIWEMGKAAINSGASQASMDHPFNLFSRPFLKGPMMYQAPYIPNMDDPGIYPIITDTENEDDN